jgi:hypothetical protein
MSQKQLSEKAESRIIQVMAVAMCVADGVDPHEAIPSDDGWKPAWKHNVEAARRQYHAALAMGRQQQIEWLSVPPVFDPNREALQMPESQGLAEMVQEASRRPVPDWGS